MANKRYTTQMRIQAVDRYSKTVTGMGKTTGRFADRVRRDLGQLQEMRGPLKLIQDFKTVQGTLRKSGKSLADARERVRKLTQEIKNTKNPTAKMRREFDKARSSAKSLERRHLKNREALSSLRTQLQSAGVDMSRLAEVESKLSRAVDASAGAFDRKMDRMRRLSKMQAKIAESRERMNRALAQAANLSFVGSAAIDTGRRLLDVTTGFTDEAKTFETAMADVKKVVDFESPEAFEQMKRDIRALSTDASIPLLASELAQIVAAGGQSGLKAQELLQFAEMAAKVGVAFDVSAEKAGDGMAKMKTAMKMDLEETWSLFNAMNHLSNNSAAKAEQTLDFLNRAGADGARFGFDANETLSFGAAMIASGAGADTAATSFRNMGRALTKGESSTKRQTAAFSKLGLNAAQVAKDMQRDAVGTTLDVIKRMNELPAHVQASVSSDLFGDEARELTKLINNMELQPKMLRLLADPDSYLGNGSEGSSVDKEFEARSSTTENNEQLTMNEWKRLKGAAGDTVLPIYNEVLDKTREILSATSEWIEANPELTKKILLGTTALAGMVAVAGTLLTGAAALIGTLAVLRFGMAGIGARAIFASGGMGGLASRILGLGGIRPNFNPALRGISGFSQAALSNLDLLASGVDRRTVAMNRSLSKIRWKGALLGLSTYLAVSQMPDEPEELQEFQEKNRRSMDSTLRATPGIGWMMEKYEEAFEWVHGKPAPVDEAFLPKDANVRAAASKVQAVAGSDNLPTTERVAALREDVAAYREEVEAANEALAAAPEFASGITNPMRILAQADLDAAEAGLRDAQDALAETEAASIELGEALRVLDGARVAPVVDAVSIDRALRKVKELADQMRNLPEGSAGVGGAGDVQTQMGPAREVTPIAGARARGGPMRARLPYMAGELGAEAIFANKSAFVATHRQTQLMQRAAGMARRLGTSAATSTALMAAVSLPSVGPAAAMQAAPSVGAGKTVHISIGSIQIPVPEATQNPRAFASSVAQEIGPQLSSMLEAQFADR
jgi:TP901 family phage tail tape measure protein